MSRTSCHRSSIVHSDPRVHADDNILPIPFQPRGMFQGPFRLGYQVPALNFRDRVGVVPTPLRVCATVNGNRDTV